ncbi:MAG: hypothetical protein QM613_00935 [Micrococcaceae bacterium]
MDASSKLALISLIVAIVSLMIAGISIIITVFSITIAKDANKRAAEAIESLRENQE